MPKISDYETLNSLTGTEKLIVSTDSGTKTVTAETLRGGVDQTYNPESTNAQSGTAVAEGLAGKAEVSHTHEVGDITGLLDGSGKIPSNRMPNVQNLKLHGSSFKNPVSPLVAEDTNGIRDAFLPIITIKVQQGRWEFGVYSLTNQLGAVFLKPDGTYQYTALVDGSTWA